MKPNKYIKILASVFTILCFSGCIDEKLTGCGDLDQEANSSNGDTYYMAMRIYNSASIEAGSRAGGPVYDSDGNEDEDGSNDKKFNIGLKSENDIYNGYTKKEDCPNFLLVFSKKVSGSSFSGYDDTTLEYLLPLYDFDYEKIDGNLTPPAEGSQTVTSTYSEYFTFYTSASKYLLPENFDDRMVLLVLNASTVLKSQLENDLLNRTKYSDILKTKLNQDKTVLRDRDFIYLTLPSGEQYLTMSSSMVIPKINVEEFKTITPKDEYGPSVYKRDIKWQTSKEKAAQNPIFSFFLERAQSKFTLTIKNGDQLCYFSDKTGSTDDSDALENGKATNHYENIGTNIVIEPDLGEIYYINDYEQRNDDEKYNDDHVREFIKSTRNYKINFAGWGVNGIERSEYLFKQVDKNKDYTRDIDREWNISSYSPYRNFWAEDVNYTEKTIYPDQFNEALKIDYSQKDSNGKVTPSIIKDTDIKSFDDIKEADTRLEYFTFSELANHATHKYAPENTLDVETMWPEASNKKLTEVLPGRDYMRAGTHIVLAAQLLIDGMEPGQLYNNPYFTTQGWARNPQNRDEKATTKYYMNGIFWSEKAYLDYVSEYLGYWMQKDPDTFGPNDGIFYVSDTQERNNANRADGKYFSIEPLKMKGTEGWSHIIPNLNSLYNTLDLEYDNAYATREGEEEEDDDKIILYSYDTDKNEYHPITRKQFEILALSHPEYFAQHFDCGRMYYATPVTHFDLGGETIYNGKYGNVRNHWYNFTVTKVNKFGTPVNRPDQDLIIPNVDHSYESLGLTLSVIPWHFIEEDVDITNQRQPAAPDQIDLDLRIRANDWYYEGMEPEL